MGTFEKESAEIPILTSAQGLLEFLFSVVRPACLNGSFGAVAGGLGSLSRDTPLRLSRHLFGVCRFGRRNCLITAHCLQTLLSRTLDLMLYSV